MLNQPQGADDVYIAVEGTVTRSGATDVKFIGIVDSLHNGFVTFGTGTVYGVDCFCIMSFHLRIL